MAHYIQRLILAGLALSVAQAADFSHALHVKLKSDCTACHAKAATSTRMEDNLLPAAEACVSCHKEVSIKQPRAVRLLKFDHAFHVKLGNVAPVIKAGIVSKTYLGDGSAVEAFGFEECVRGVPSRD